MSRWNAIRVKIKRWFQHGIIADRHRIYRQIVELWVRDYWWRFPPPEGWHIGYTTNSFPKELCDHLQANGGQIQPVTAAEVHRATGVPITFIRNHFNFK